MTASRMSGVGHARRVLFGLGNELPGEKLAHLVAGLLAATDSQPNEPASVLIDRALGEIQDGPLALVAEEPWLAKRKLTEPATTAHDAARLAVLDFARDLLARNQTRDFDDLWEMPRR